MNLCFQVVNGSTMKQLLEQKSNEWSKRNGGCWDPFEKEIATIVS